MGKVRKDVHVVWREGNWGVLIAGNKRATAILETKTEAIKMAEELARKYETDTKIHGEDGKIQSGNSYGNDPCPPKDKK